MKRYDTIDPLLVASTKSSRCQRHDRCSFRHRHEGHCADVGTSGLVHEVFDGTEGSPLGGQATEAELAHIGEIERALRELEQARDDLDHAIRVALQGEGTRETRLGRYVTDIDRQSDSIGADGTPITDVKYWTELLAEYEDE